MAYIGKSIESGTFSVLDTSGNTYNGSNTTFSLGTQVGSPAQLLVSHDGVIQKPGTDYTLATGGTQITFSTAPASGASIFIVEISGAVGGPLDSDLNGTELILDADGDTSLHASTDDQIDVKIAGADDFKFSANAMNVLSGSTLTIDSGATITNSGTANGFGTDPDGAQVFNESSADVDFRVESNGNTHMFFIDGGNNRVGMVTTPDLGTGLHIRTADSGASVSGDADELVLENSANAGLSILSATNGIGRIAFGDSGDNAAGVIDYNHSDNMLKLSTAGGDRFRLFSDGDINLGTGGASANFTNEASLAVRRADGQNAIVGHFNSLSTNYDSTVMNFMCSRDTSNNSFSLIQGRNGGGMVFQVKDSGNVANTNNNYGSISDSRIKQDIEDASSQWDDIKALKIRKYKLKKYVNRDGAENTPYHLGVIAQELEASNMNGLVEENKPEKEDVALHSDFGSIDSEDNFTAGQKKKEVKYSILYMKAIKALQEAMAKIESLEARVTTLEG